MRKAVLFIFLFLSVISANSCSLQKNATEFIQFNHNNVMVIAGDKLTITLIPTQKKRKRPVIVKISRNDVQFDNKRIKIQEYYKIRDLIIQTKQKEVEFPNNVGILDAGSNSIYYKKDTLNKKLYVRGISKEYHGKFYEAAELILKTANLNTQDID
ncbi:hypothetical protein [Chryseobacterium aquaticum]|uniref:hypothetical protein n=1 Tax=Chryseobacterium aquaticum TaxID=452084 RepID=UPI003F726F12